MVQHLFEMYRIVSYTLNESWTCGVCFSGESDAEFQGMHRIERMLYRDGITSGGNNFTEKTLNEWALQVQATYVSLGDKINAVRP